MKQKLTWYFLNYLRLLARLQIAKVKLLLKLKGQHLIIIGVTGSAGKSSTVAAIEAALKPLFTVKTTALSNSETGIPLNILGISIKDYSPPDWLRIFLLAPVKLLINWHLFNLYVVEMGIETPTEPKNISYQLKIIQPSIGVFLNVTPVHLMNFSSLDQIAQEKAVLIKSLGKSDTAILNLSDPLVKKYSTTTAKIIPIKPLRVKIDNHILPPVYDISFGAAVAVAKVLGLNPTSTISNLKSNFHLPPSRSTILNGINNSILIDSSYNSSPLACQEMLQFLSGFPSPKIAILGDMRELGLATAKSHQDIYNLASKICNLIVSVGPETAQYFGSKSHKFTYWWQALDYIKQVLPRHCGATVLIKGSQNTIFLEEIVKCLLLNPKDANLICRQSAYWLKTKSQFRLSHS